MRRGSRNPKMAYWADCAKCGCAASSHGMTGKTSDTNTATRGGRYPNPRAGCDGYIPNVEFVGPTGSRRLVRVVMKDGVPVTTNEEVKS